MGLIDIASSASAWRGYEYYKESKEAKKDLEQDFQDCEGELDEEFCENADEAAAFETKEANPDKKEKLLLHITKMRQQNSVNLLLYIYLA